MSVGIYKYTVIIRLTTHALCVYRNNEARSRNHCCRGKATGVNIFWVCVCSLCHSARKAHEPYCHLWSVRLYHIFPRYFINGTIFGKHVMECKLCVLVFCAAFIWNHSHYKKNRARCYHTCTYIGLLHVKYRLLLSDFSEIWIFLTDFWSSIKFREYSSSGSRVIPFEHKDKHKWHSW